MVEHVTPLLDGPYFALEPGSRNRDEVDYRALLASRPQVLVHNPDGCYQLLREGHAVASRNILAAIYDSLRLCNTL